MKRSIFGSEPQDQAPSGKNQRSIGGDAAQSNDLAEHTVQPDETLSHIALKVYGSSAREKWMAIYEANRATIGDDPSMIRAGMVLKIPKLT